MLTWSLGWTRVYVAARAAEQLGGAVGQHLVHVHVVRRAGAGLIDVDDELIAQLPGEHLVGGPDDRVADLRGRAVRARALASAAAFLMQTVAVTRSACARSPLIGKFSSARTVWMP